MTYSEFQPSIIGTGSDGRRFERERGFADNDVAEHEARLAASRLWLAGGGVDSRGGNWCPQSAGASPASTQMADARLVRSIRFALLLDGYSTVDVTVVDGYVTLSGTVADIPARVLAEDCCLRQPEVREVQNLIQVLPATPLERQLGA